MAPRKGEPPGGIGVLDVHVDPVDWPGGGGFVGDGLALGQLVGALRREREGGDQGAIWGPVGVMTHHLVMDSATEDFLSRLGETVGTHAAACWVDIRELLPPGGAGP
jgi:hypothetical protein